MICFEKSDAFKFALFTNDGPDSTVCRQFGKLAQAVGTRFSVVFADGPCENGNRIISQIANCDAISEHELHCRIDDGPMWIMKPEDYLRYIE